MDSSLNPSSDARARRAAVALTIGLAACLQAFAQQVPFAEDLFPELKPLLQAAASDGLEQQLAGLRVEERAGDLDVAQGQRRPQVRLWARALASYETREDIEDEFRGVADGNITVTQPLYHWGNLERREDVARKRLELEQLEAGRTGVQQAMALRRAYLEWLLLRERRAILGQSIAVTEAFVAAREQLVEAGQYSEQDVLDVQARLLENQEGLAWVGKRIADLEAQMRRMVGPSLDLARLGSASLEVIKPLGEEKLAALAARVEGAQLTGEPQIGRFALLERIEEQNLATLDRNTWPTFDWVTGAFTDQIDAVNQQDSVFRIQYFTGVQVSWNIFDSWQTDGLKRSTLARKRAFALNREAAGEAARERAAALLAELQLNQRQIDARAKREVILARRLELLREQAQRDLITGINLVEGEIDYLDVRQRLMEARMYYLINLMELGGLLGLDPAASHPNPAS